MMKWSMKAREEIRWGGGEVAYTIEMAWFIKVSLDRMWDMVEVLFT